MVAATKPTLRDLLHEAEAIQAEAFTRGQAALRGLTTKVDVPDEVPSLQSVQAAFFEAVHVGGVLAGLILPGEWDQLQAGLAKAPGPLAARRTLLVFLAKVIQRGREKMAE